jgi:TPR repeat protein
MTCGIRALACALLVSCGGHVVRSADPGTLAKERADLEEGCGGGDGESCTALGDMIMEGEEPDAGAARGWFEKGCELEEAEACLVGSRIRSSPCSSTREPAIWRRDRGVRCSMRSAR